MSEDSSQLELANDALWAVVETTFAEVSARHRNPSGHTKPAIKESGVAAYIAQTDDEDPEVLRVMCGPIYDLRAITTITFAFSGKTKDERQQMARAFRTRLVAALEADHTLGGACEYADIDGSSSIDAGDTDWMAGGLDVRVGLLFTAATRAG